MALVDALVFVLVLLGLAGTLLPFLPGTALILVGALVHAVAHGFDPIGPWRLLALALLTLAAVGLDYLAGALGVRRFGGSGWATAGAVVGALVGILFGLVGLVLGPLLGALLAEYLYTRRLDASLRSALGTVVGLLLGAVAKFGVAVVMAALFAYWVWRG
jgi:uncharacterized protein YqgC (DUF456 family)